LLRAPRSNRQLITLIAIGASGDDNTPSGESDKSTGVDGTADAPAVMPLSAK
jgi:hypothetical protein